MKRSHWMTAAALALAALAPAAWAAPTPDEASPLAWVPANAPVVIHANSPETLRDHVVAFLKNAVPDQADRAEKQINDAMNNIPNGRKLKGIPKDGSMFLVLTDLPPVTGPGASTPPKMTYITAVSSASEFRDNFLVADEKKNLKGGEGFDSTTGPEGPLYLVDKKDHVVVTQDKDVAIGAAKGGAAGLDGKLNKGQAAKFLASDLGLYIDVEALNAKYADQLKQAHKAVEEQLDQLEKSLGGAQKAQFEVIRKAIGPLFQAVEDGKLALFTAEVEAHGVRLHAGAVVRTGTPTADLLKTAKTAAFEDLGKMPAGDVFYSGMELDPTLLKFAGALLTGFAANPDAKGAKDFTAAFDDWIKAGPSESLGTVNYPISGMFVTKCADPEKALAAQLKMLESMGTEGGFMNVSFKEKPEIKANAEKVGDISFTSVHMVWDLDKMMGAAGGQLPEAMKKKMVEGMKKLMGEELNMWLGVDGKSMVAVMGKDWDSAKKTLDQYQKGQGGVGEDKGFTAVREQLPKQASVVVVMDVVQYAGDMLEFMGPIMQGSGAPLPAKFPKPVKDKPGFVGFAVSLHPEGGAIDIVVPADTVKLVYESYVAPLMPKD